jgi:hypothetical protein
MKQILKKLRIRMSGNVPVIAEVLEATVPSKVTHICLLLVCTVHTVYGDCKSKTGVTDILHTSLYYNE